MGLSVTSLGVNNNGQFPINRSVRITLASTYPRGGYALASHIGSPGMVHVANAAKNGKGLTFAWIAASNKLMVFQRPLDPKKDVLGDTIVGSAVVGSLDTHWIAKYSASITGWGLVYVGCSSAAITTVSRGKVVMTKFSSAGSTSLGKGSVIFGVSKKIGQQIAASFTAFTVKPNDMLTWRKTVQGKGGGNKGGRAKVYLAWQPVAAACEINDGTALASIQVDLTVFKQVRF